MGAWHSSCTAAPPADDAIPAGAEGDAIRSGREVALHTFERLEFRSRAAREITIEERIDECFERSMNGTALAAYFIEQARPDFAGKADDWPRGGKPPDARC